LILATPKAADDIASSVWQAALRRAAIRGALRRAPPNQCAPASAKRASVNESTSDRGRAQRRQGSPAASGSRPE